MSAYDDRRLWPGTVPPVAGSIARAPGSVRRTTSVDLVRPAGFRGPLVISGAGRDLVTGADGEASVVATGATEVVVDYVGDRCIRSIAATPDVADLQALVGARAGSGFRRALAEACPDLVRSGSVVHQLLDDVTPGVLISGSSLARAGLVKLAVDPSVGPASNLPIGICAGWQAGGAMLDAIAETGVPLLGWGPPAPSLVGDDPLGWHEVDDLPPGSLRRRRLIDLAADGGGVADGAGVAVGVGVAADVRFRDSYWEPDGTETVVHEYGLRVSLDAATWQVRAAAAIPGPLPAPECPSAAASAERLVGHDARSLRELVRTEFTGTSTCTHLNDALRSLADAAHLWGRRGRGVTAA